MYKPNALTRDHVNNFRDTSTPICRTGTSGRHLHWAQCWISDQLDICVDYFNPHNR